MPIVIPRLCAITDRALAGGLTHEAITRALIRGGASWIQLRDKSLSPRQFLTEASAAVNAVRSAGSALVVVNDRVDIALASGADGVHVGRDDLPPEDARMLMGTGAFIGVSTHSLEEGIGAAVLPVDYVAIGPVFSTSTKFDAEPVVGLDTVRMLASAIRLPVIGIGGIGSSNARSVIEAGARAVAVISALYEGGRSIEESVERLLRSLEDV